MVFACLVAYYRGGFIDKFTVFVTVLGMCIPYLAYMLLGQWIMFNIAPKFAAGLASPAAIYVPVAIAVVAGLGGSVRFYRVVILNEINKDYVRTARAKGVPLPAILFKHVLKNCMLPILTEVISEIPFLIMGALLLEKFFGVPGLGDLFLTSITSRDVPIITGLTYFTTILYVVSLLLTDILYAVFDPRIRLQ
jgi:peptide/nickel transport system permease protein